MNQLEKFRSVKTFLFEISGVITTKQVLINSKGEWLNKLSIRDLFAMEKAVEAGFRIGIISHGKMKGLKKRLEKIGIKDFYLNVSDKLPAYEFFVSEYEYHSDDVLFMGQDLDDYTVLRKVGLPCCPKDAAPEILTCVQYIAPFQGGEGCVRDVIEKVLRLQDKWPKLE